MTITITDIINIVRKIVDVSLVWLIFYFILKNIKNNVKLSMLFKGVAIILVLKFVSDWLGLTTIEVLLEYIIQWGPVALIIIFQPEIRNILEQLGRSQLLGRHKILTVDEREHLVYEIVQAMEYLRKERIGALIVLERDISLGNYIDKAKKVYADLTSDLLIAIFYEGNPLHDGGVIIQGDRISCAGAVFPTSNSTKINRRLGTRHRAALGISEETDCISLLVSEETGRMSVAVKGELYYNLSIDDINTLSSYKRDSLIEANSNSLIIYNNKMKSVTVDKVGMSIDVVPTVYNLFGMEYDSRLIMGKDILSTSPGIAIFKDKSWITNKGTYYASKGQFVGDDVEDSYIDNINNVVNNRIAISRMIVSSDYYRSIFN